MNPLTSTISVLHEDQLTHDQRENFLAFEEKCFEKDLKANRKLLYFSTPFAHILFTKNQDLISYLRVFIRQVTWNDKSILLGGIGSVATDQKYRGKGIATRLLKKAMDILTEQGVDFALLQTDISKGKKLYGSIGFYPANIGYTFLDANNQLHTIKGRDVMVAPVRNKQLLLEVLASEKNLHIGRGDW